MTLRRTNLKERLWEPAWLWELLYREFWSLEYDVVVYNGATQCVSMGSCSQANLLELKETAANTESERLGTSQQRGRNLRSVEINNKQLSSLQFIYFLNKFYICRNLFLQYIVK